MQSVVLLMVAAVWLAVILPPVLRSRSQNRTTSSMQDFRRQLSHLQHSVPTRTMVPARSMGRPLTQAPRYQNGRYQAAGPQIGAQQRQAVQRHTMRTHGTSHGELRRSPEAPGQRQHQRDHAPHRQMHLHRVSQRELMRRRRANVLFVLATLVVVTGFLAATTHAAAMVWLFGLSFLVSSAYAYRLADLNRRRTDVDHTFGYQMPWLQHPQHGGQVERQFADRPY